MKTRILALGALALFTAQAANAAVYYDTLNSPPVPSVQLHQDTDGAAEMASTVANSFTLSSPVDLSITLALAAPGAGTGSFMIYLFADDGSGGGINQAGLPNFLGGSLLYAGLDSALSGDVAAPSLVSFGIDHSLLSSFSSSNQEFWIGVILTPDSTLEWTLNGDGSGTGTLGQGFYDDGTTANSGFIPISGFAEALEMTVADPEPASLAVIGVGLAGLGYVRRRRSQKQA